MTPSSLDRAAAWMAAARKAIVLTGAGVSTESGIPDFRGAGGLWSRYDPAEYATLGAFLRNPAKVWNMLADLDEVLNARPNAGHVALAELERRGVVKGIITQNIDGLHQAAGSRTVVEYHGSGRTLTCLGCGRRFTREEARAMDTAPGSRMPLPATCPEGREGPGGPGRRCVLKPDVVFFDELIPGAAVAAGELLVRDADLILVIGTSCEVFPAAEIPAAVRRQGGRVVEINLEPAAALRPDLLLQGKAGEVVPALAGRLGT